MPFMPGILTSKNTPSNFSVESFFRASRPFRAVTTRNPYASRRSCTTSRISSSSSVRRTLSPMISLSRGSRTLFERSVRRQDKRKRAPFVQFTLDPDPSPMHFNQSLTDRKAEPGPFRFFLARLTGLVELIKNFADLIGRNTRAGIGDGDLYPIVHSLPNGNRNLSVRWSELDGITHQIKQDLDHLIPVGPGSNFAVVRSYFQSNKLLDRDRSYVLDHFRSYRGQVKIAGPEVDLSCFDS